MSYLFRYYAGVYDRFMDRFNLDDDSIIIDIIGPGNKKVADVGGGTGRTADKLVKQPLCYYYHPSIPMANRQRKEIIILRLLINQCLLAFRRS